MPELPEVETTRRHVERLFKGKRLVEVIPDEDDRIVFDRATPAQFRKAVEGAKVTGTGRKGKYFWIELDRRPWPVFHLGMSGNVETRIGKKDFVKAWGGAKLWSEPKRGKESERARFLPYCKLRMLTRDGSEFALTDPRRFGRIRLAEDPLNEKPISELGFDPLLDFPTAKNLAEIVGKRKAPIKAILMDQGLFAGVGNWMADEILFQAKLAPQRKGSALSASEIARLRTKLLAVVKTAVAVNADYDRYPSTWLFHHRWGKGKEAQTSRGHKVEFDTIGGRTSAWVPTVQR